MVGWLLNLIHFYVEATLDATNSDQLKLLDKHVERFSLKFTLVFTDALPKLFFPCIRILSLSSIFLISLIDMAFSIPKVGWETIALYKLA